MNYSVLDRVKVSIKVSGGWGHSKLKKKKKLCIYTLRTDFISDLFTYPQFIFPLLNTEHKQKYNYHLNPFFIQQCNYSKVCQSCVLFPNFSVYNVQPAPVSRHREPTDQLEIFLILQLRKKIQTGGTPRRGNVNSCTSVFSCSWLFPATCSLQGSRGANLSEHCTGF